MANLISGITFVNTYNGGLGYWGGYHPQISYDGTFVSFDTIPGVATYVGYTGPNLPPFINISGNLTSSGAEHIYLKNMATGALEYLDPVVIGAFGLDESPGGDPTSISADGRFVAYEFSGANADQLSIFDTSTHSFISANTSASGITGNGFSGSGMLSTTGRYVAFRSSSTNLVADDTNGFTDVFLKDTVTGAISLVSALSNGTLGNGASDARSVSSDGRYVLFETFATNLGGQSSSLDIFVKDMQAGTLVDMGVANLGAKHSSMTPDGRYVVFDISPFDSFAQVYRFDTTTQTTVLVSTGPNGAGNGDSKAFLVGTDNRAGSISADGRFVAFASTASNFVPNDTNGSTQDIFVKDLTTGGIARLSVSATGVQADEYSLQPHISGDGHYVVFQSYATNLIAGDNNSNPDLFMTINPFWVSPPSPDFTASSLAFDGNAVSYSLNNVATVAVPASTAGIYLSADATITTADTPLTTRPVPTLDGSSSYADSVSVSFPGFLTPGNYYLGIIADSSSQIAESSETNNTSNTVPVILGDSSDNALTGTSGDDAILGLGGNDTLVGGIGNDTLNGGAGADRLLGGAGNDLYFVDGQPDLVFENTGEGTDTVIASTSFYLYDNIENLTLAAGAGDIFGSANASDNTLTGNEGINLLLGWDGNDTIFGGAGNDIVYGVNGADSLMGGAGVDVLVGGDGNDVLDGGSEADALYGDNGNDVLYGGTGFSTDILVGGTGSDSLDGSAAVASGQTRNLGDFDFLYGEDGDDTYYVDTPADLTFEFNGLTGGNDSVIADITGAGYYLYDSVENLTLTGDTPFGVGNASNNILTGSALTNFLLGGAGNDTINGKAGNDVLFGEAGSDTFIFERGTGGDVIGDFQPGVDTMRLIGIGYDSFADLNGHMVQNGATSAIDLGAGDIVVLHNVTIASLSAGDFLFT